MKTKLVGDRELFQNILSLKTKYPLTRENWFNFIKSNYTLENTLFHLDLQKYIEIHHDISIRMGGSSDLIVERYSMAEGMLDIKCEAINQQEFNEWNRLVCAGLIEKYVALRAIFELNLDAEVRKECLSQFENRIFHPKIFDRIAEIILFAVIQNDLAKFKAETLDQNIQAVHVNARLAATAVFLALTIFLYIMIFQYSLPQYYRLAGFPLMCCGVSCWLQYKYKFSVALAGAKKQNIKGYLGFLVIEDDYAFVYQGKRATKVQQKTIIISLIVTIILFVVPPYQWN